MLVSKRARDITHIEYIFLFLCVMLVVVVVGSVIRCCCRRRRTHNYKRQSNRLEHGIKTEDGYRAAALKPIFKHASTYTHINILNDTPHRRCIHTHVYRYT